MKSHYAMGDEAGGVVDEDGFYCEQCSTSMGSFGARVCSTCKTDLVCRQCMTTTAGGVLVCPSCIKEELHEGSYD